MMWLTNRLQNCSRF